METYDPQPEIFSLFEQLNITEPMKSEVLSHIKTIIEKGRVNIDDLPRNVGRAFLKASLNLKGEVTPNDVYKALLMMVEGRKQESAGVNTSGEKRSVSTGTPGTPTPGSRFTYMGTPGTSVNSPGTQRKTVNFESSRSELVNFSEQRKFTVFDYDMTTLLTATKQALYQAYTGAGKSTKRSEYLPLRLAVIYLLTRDEATLEEVIKGVAELIETYNIRTKLNADELRKSLNSVPGVKAGPSKIGLTTYTVTDYLRNKIIEKYMILTRSEEQAEKYSTSGDREGMIEAFARFLRDYVVEVNGKQEYKYRNELAKLLTEKLDKGLMIDWLELNAMSPSLAEITIESPEDTIYAAEDAVALVLREDFLIEKPPRIHVRFYNLPTTLSPKWIRTSHIGRLVQIRGMITAIPRGEMTNGVSGFIEKAVFVCKVCGNEMIWLQRPYGKLVRPAKCDACGSKNIELDLEKSRIMDMRRIIVQDSAEAMSGTTNPSYVEVILLDDLARMDLNPGDEVIITAIIRGILPKQNERPEVRSIAEANSVIKLTLDAEDIEITSEDERRFREMAEDPDFEWKFIQSIAPDVIGDNVILAKKASAWTLFSGDDIIVANDVVRKRSHVLLYGPPGVAKTRIAKFTVELMPRHYWISATSATGAGLTAAIDSLDGKRVLKAGAFVIADGGAVGVNEFDKMNAEEYNRVLDALEEGWFPLDKAGFHARLAGRVRMIATANPPGGEFNPNKTPLDELYQQFPKPLLSRIDLIIPVFKPDKKFHGAIADSIYYHHRKEVSAPYDVETLKKYIAYAHRTIKEVEIPVEVWNVAKEYILSVADKSWGAMTRMTESFIRLMEARARMHLRNRVTLQDFEAVKALYSEMLRGLLQADNEDDVLAGLSKFAGVTWTEKERVQVDTLYDIIRYYEQVAEDGTARVDDIIEEAKAHGISRHDVVKFLDEMVRERMIYEVRIGRYSTRPPRKGAFEEVAE